MEGKAEAEQQEGIVLDGSGNAAKSVPSVSTKASNMAYSSTSIPTSARNEGRESKEGKSNKKTKRRKLEDGNNQWNDHLIWKLLMFEQESPDVCTRKEAKALAEIRQRIKSHPEEANKTSDLFGRCLRNAPKALLECFDRLPSILHIVVHRAQTFPIEIVDELIRAFPAAVSCQSKTFSTPLGLLFGESDDSLAYDSHTGQLARLLMERMITPSSTEIANAIPRLPADIVERHVFPYLGDPLAQLETYGSSALMVLLARRKKFNSAADDMIHRILDIVPRSASPIPSFPGQQPFDGLFPLHFASLIKCPFDIIQKLIRAYPGALTVKGASGGLTPLHMVCNRRKVLEVIRLLIESGPEALSMISDDGFTPLHCALAHRYCDIDASCIRLITRLNPQALEIPEPLHGDLPLHLACKYFEGDRIDVDALAALANGYRDAVSTTNRDELTPRQMIQNGQHPDKEDIVRMLDSL